MLHVHLSLYQTYINRHLIPGATFERSPCSLLLHTTLLLEEKRDFRHQALIPNIRDLFVHGWPGAWTRFADQNCFC